jgi:hypothetical protein
MDYTTYPPGSAGATIDAIRATLKSADGKAILNPACQEPLETAEWNSFGASGVTWDNIYPVTNFVHKWIPGEFFLKGTVVGTTYVGDAFGTNMVPGFPYIGLDPALGGVGSANSGLFTKRTIAEMISGYNDTVKQELSGDGWYGGLYGNAQRRFVKPSGPQKRCLSNNGNDNEDCDLYGSYTGKGDIDDMFKLNMVAGATAIVDRNDLNEECSRPTYPHAIIYPFQIHLPDEDGSYDGYDSCDVWLSPEQLDGQLSGAAPPQYSDFITVDVAASPPKFERNKDDYEPLPFAFYNSGTARFTNMTSDGVLYDDDTKGVPAFKYEVDDKMWQASPTNPQNSKYRMAELDGVMEVSSTNGVPMFVSKPYLEGFDGDDDNSAISSWISVNGDYSETEDYGTYIWVEPLTGMAIKGDVKAQVNFGLNNQMLDTITFYENAMANGYTSTRNSNFSTTIIPFFWVELSSELFDEQADDALEIFEDTDDAILAFKAAFATMSALFIAGIVILVLGCLSTAGSGAVQEGDAAAVAPAGKPMEDDGSVAAALP